MDKINILVGADLVPTKANKDLFIEGNAVKLVGEKLNDILTNSDARVFNLETPLIEKETPILKVGPNLGIDKETIKGIKALNPSFLTLANNHIMDHGVEGLETTIDTLKKNNIEFGGIGKNIEEASKIYIKNIGNIKIGFYCCVESEFSNATENTPGANYFDVFNSFEHVNNISKNVDFLIILYHGGKEYYPYPSPLLQKRCRKFIDNGADIVICQHSHCIGCEENYNNKKIIYGQGNFLFDLMNRKEWENGLLIKLTISKNHVLNDFSYIVTQKVNNRITLADSTTSKKILDEMKMRSNQIKEQNFIKENYADFSKESIYMILKRLDYFSSTLLFKGLNLLSKRRFERFYFNKFYLKRKALSIQNTIDCEAWQELLLEGVKNYSLERKK